MAAESIHAMDAHHPRTGRFIGLYCSGNLLARRDARKLRTAAAAESRVNGMSEVIPRTAAYMAMMHATTEDRTPPATKANRTLTTLRTAVMMRIAPRYGIEAGKTAVAGHKFWCGHQYDCP
jgi:hypothetical protein